MAEEHLSPGQAFNKAAAERIIPGVSAMMEHIAPWDRPLPAGPVRVFGSGSVKPLNVRVAMRLCTKKHQEKLSNNSVLAQRAKAA
jgi:hypothetical protein